MGVQGLTSYVNQRSDIYFESHQLRDCALIIDGYGLAAQLYNSSSKINSAFGGDYDKYCKLISNFFDILLKCKIKPLVICDGGYEKKKLTTVKRRNLQRVYALEKVSPSCTNLQCFPLMMRHVFREKLLEMSIPMFQTDFEADSEIAALARKLDAPVLSNDSDFFIFDVHYITLSSMPFDCCESNGSNYYIPCKLFRVNNLLKSFGNLPKIMLPLLATVLGNDYIKSSQFKKFYNHLKMDKSKKLKPGQKRVKAIVNWLKDETFESAVHKILQCLKKNARRHAKRNIVNIIKGYTNLNTTLDNYLPEYFHNKNAIDEALELTNTFKSLCHIESSEESEDEDVCSEKSHISSTSNEDSDSEDGKINDADLSLPEDGKINDADLSLPEDEILEINMTLPKNVQIPTWLIHESRLGNVCPSINTLLLLKIYFYCPQIEDYECPWAGSITLPILQVIVGLLGLSSISYWYRMKSRYVSSQLLSINSTPKLNFPELSVLNKLSLSEKQLIIFNTLLVKNSSVLESCALEWQLYFMSIVYWVTINEDAPVKYWHLHALIITMITINVINEKVGIFWHKKTFLKKYNSKLKSLLKSNVSKKGCITYDTINEALEAVTFDDCLLALDTLIPYFHIDENLNRNSKKFSRRTIHIYAQLQSTFELAVTLNSLLSQPFKRCHLGKLYNGTFLYNFTVNFKTRSNILSYMELLLGKAPSVLNLYSTTYNILMSLIPAAPTQVVKQKKTRKKKETRQTNVESSVEEEAEAADEDFNDFNNPFSLLNKQIIINR